MVRDINLNDEFARAMLEGVAPHPPNEPQAFYNESGDCIEFLISDESYFAERVDDLLTVYYGQESGEIVGSQIKGVKKFIREVHETNPGFMIEVQDGNVKLQHLFTARIWSSGDGIRGVVYSKLRDAAEQSNIEVEIPELV